MELRGFCPALLAKRKANHLSRPGSSPAFFTHRRFSTDRSWRDASHCPHSLPIGIYTSQSQTPGFTGWSQSGEDDFTHGGCRRLPAQTGQPFFQPGPFGPGFKPNSTRPKAWKAGPLIPHPAFADLEFLRRAELSEHARTYPYSVTDCLMGDVQKQSARSRP